MRRAALLAGLFLAALSLRPQLVGTGPLLPAVQRDLGVSHAVAGLLGTVPILCMGLFAPPAPFVSGRLGSRAALAASLALIGVFGVARAAAPGAALVILLTFPIGIGMGIAGALLPVWVKERFADRPAFATGVYAGAISIGATLSSATAVPLAHALGGWQAPLYVFSGVTVGLAAVWLRLTRDEPAHVRTAARPLRLPYRSATGWRLVGAFFLVTPALLRATVFRRMYENMGAIRYSIMILLLLLMALMPIKMVLRWLFNCKYFIYLPEFNASL